jgi:hypothetical protein
MTRRPSSGLTALSVGLREISRGAKLVEECRRESVTVRHGETVHWQDASQS